MNASSLLYRKHQSTKTALLRVQNASVILIASVVVFLILLDLSVYTGCYKVILEFISKSFFFPGKHFMAWYLFICELTNLHSPSRQLHSSHKNLLSIPWTFSSNGDRAFHVCAPWLWNSLHAALCFCSSLDIFKKTLKTHLFMTVLRLLMVLLFSCNCILLWLLSYYFSMFCASE